MIFKTDIRTILIVVLSVILFFSFDGCGRVSNLFEGAEVVKEQKTITIDTTVNERTYLDFKPFPEIFKPVKQKVEISNGKVKEVPENTPVQNTEEKEVLEVNKYETTNKLPNGTIKSTLLIKGELLGTEYELTTTDTTITKEIETIRTVVQSGLFAVGGSTLGFGGRIKDVSVGLQYIHKNQWFVGVGVEYDVDPIVNLPMQHRAGVEIRFGFKL